MTATNRITDGLLAWVLKATSFVRWYPIFGARCVKQNADGTLELQPDAPLLPSLSNVPIRSGVPGMTVTIAPDARVALAFTDGDPTKPVVTLWESASVTKLTITATDVVFNAGGSTGATPVAKEGSATTGHHHQVLGTAGPFPIVLTTPTPPYTFDATDSIAAGAGSPHVKVP